eukprot:1184828-Prorocentrum_minimum.AAC.2
MTSVKELAGELNSRGIRWLDKLLTVSSTVSVSSPTPQRADLWYRWTQPPGTPHSDAHHRITVRGACRLGPSLPQIGNLDPSATTTCYLRRGVRSDGGVLTREGVDSHRTEASSRGSGWIHIGRRRAHEGGCGITSDGGELTREGVDSHRTEVSSRGREVLSAALQVYAMPPPFSRITFVCPSCAPAPATPFTEYLATRAFGSGVLSSEVLSARTLAVVGAGGPVRGSNISRVQGPEWRQLGGPASRGL